MKKNLFSLLIAILCVATTQAQIPTNYYSSAQGLSGYTLKSELSSIISNGHTAQGYGDLWDAYYTSDVDNYYENDGTVLDIYSEKPNATDAYNYTLGSDQCGNVSASEGGCYNREHSFPKSWFNDASPMYTDMHHIFPTDGQVNSQRSNFPYGEVGNASWTSTNGTKKGNNNYNFPNAYNGTVFEPIDEFKGDLARVYFYMATRYENQISGWETSNTGSDATLNGTSNQVFEDWMLAMLIDWHNADPVSQKEIDRNNAAYIFQGNRNPFVDNPQYAAQIWGTPDNQSPTAPTNLDYNNLTNSSVELTWNAATDNIAVVSYQIKQNGAEVATISATNTTYLATNLTPETAYYFEVFALDAYGNISSASNMLTVTTLEAAEVIFSEDFNDCQNVQFTPVSELSTQDWQCQTEFGEDNTGCFQMNSYSQGSQIPSIDWLITTNSINLDNYTQEKLSFYTDAAYGNSELQLLYSTDYNAANAPSNTTWTAVPNLTIPQHPSGNANELIFEFNDIDISSISGNVYFAFKYDTSNGENATRWTVDSFRITGEQNLSVSTKNQLTLNIYPNPSHGKLTISIPSAKEFEYAIYDLNGRLLQQKKNSATQISVENLASGLYLLQVSSEGKTASKKLIIN
ncbi:endonuclease [Mesonia aestuariivivens]|uniref:Endonuclease n=1 Tax=Mesonia aestuariivivens TaxID=2796128 RepID=A0ABS6W0S0_9FLAO|nr:endonuclease [Mesonia aestuariivivens]MBW2961450.1 endonuclease [Mesonia aestuariivivens]